MVVPSTTTEYTRSYKPKVFTRAAKIYGDNLEFRTQKRETERNHATSPFMWDPSDLETDSSDRSNAIRPLSAPPHKYKHEKFNRSYQKRLQQLEEEEEESPSPGTGREHRRRRWRSQSRSLSRGRCSGESASRPSKPSRSTPSQTNFDRVHIYRDQGVQTPDWTRMKGHKAVHASASFESSSSESSPDWQMRNNKQNSRQRRGYQSPRSVEGHSDHVTSDKADRWRIKCKGYRVQSSPSPESVHRRVYRGTACANVNTNGVVHQSAPVPQRKPPFVAYGCQYRDRETGQKKTHNVLAASEIHPTAIQALKRRQVEKAIKQKQSRPKTERPKSQQSMMSEFDHKMNKDTAKWVTEYQSHYPRYCNTEYERNIMSRQQQTPRSGHNYYIDW